MYIICRKLNGVHAFVQGFTNMANQMAARPEGMKMRTFKLPESEAQSQYTSVCQILARLFFRHNHFVRRNDWQSEALNRCPSAYIVVTHLSVTIKDWGRVGLEVHFHLHHIQTIYNNVAQNFWRLVVFASHNFSHHNIQILLSPTWNQPPLLQML